MPLTAWPLTYVVPPVILGDAQLPLQIVERYDHRLRDRSCNCCVAQQLPAAVLAPQDPKDGFNVAELGVPLHPVAGAAGAEINDRLAVQGIAHERRAAARRTGRSRSPPADGGIPLRDDIIAGGRKRLSASNNPPCSQFPKWSVTKSTPRSRRHAA